MHLFKVALAMIACISATVGNPMEESRTDSRDHILTVDPRLTACYTKCKNEWEDCKKDVREGARTWADGTRARYESYGKTAEDCRRDHNTCRATCTEEGLARKEAEELERETNKGTKRPNEEAADAVKAERKARKKEYQKKWYLAKKAEEAKLAEEAKKTEETEEAKKARAKGFKGPGGADILE